MGDVIVNQLSSVMGAEISGVDLAEPLAEDVFQEIGEAFHRHMLLVFPDQRIDQYRHPRYPEIYVLSNVDKSGKTTGTHPDKGTLVWHSDLSFQRRPAMQDRVSSLKAIHDLDASRMRAGEPPMTAKQRAAAPPVEHPVVRTRHRWGPRDVVMWDNRCTMHCATPYDAGAERRVIHRTVVLVSPS